MRKSEEYIALEREEKELEGRLEVIAARLDELMFAQQDACAHKDVSTFLAFTGTNLRKCMDCGAINP